MFDRTISWYDMIVSWYDVVKQASYFFYDLNH